MPLLQVQGLEKSFVAGAKAAAALRGASLSLEAGETVALLGPSGCGKSTLLHLIAGLDRPDGGSIQINGIELGSLRDRDLALLRRRQLGIVFQFFNLFSSLSLLDNVLLPGVLDRKPLAPLQRRARDLLKRMDLAKKAEARVQDLSGGEMQRAALCRALLQKPDLLLADEPTGNLDSLHRLEVYRLLQDLSQENGCAVLMVTHDPEALPFMKRYLRMRDGKVEAP